MAEKQSDGGNNGSQHLSIPYRNAKGQLLPGNPISNKPGEKPRGGNGRNPGLAARARKATHDGKDIVDYWVQVLNDATEKTVDRLRAAELLAARGWGTKLDIDLEGGLILLVQRVKPDADRPG